MKKPTAAEIIARYDRLKSQRSTWESHWQEIADFMMPYKNSISRQQEGGARRNDDITNDTATQANDRLASGVFGFLCPPKEQWFRFAPLSLELANDEDSIFFFNECSRLVMEALYSSNYALQMHEDLQDLGAFGTSCMYIEPGKTKILRFKSIPIQSFVMAESADGEIDTILQKFKLNARQMAQKWGVEALGDKAKKCALKGGAESDKDRDIIHAVFPRTDLLKKKVTKDNLPIASYYVDVDDKHIIEEGGYHEMPYVAGRFMKSSDEIYGRGPGVTCLPRIKMLNSMGYTIYRTAEKMVDPPVLYPDDGVVSGIGMNPGDIIFLRSSYYENKPVPFEIKGNLPIGLEMLDREEQSIERGFYTELFDALADRRNMTATEVAERVEKKLLLFVPIMARIQAEKITPMLERVFGIMMRADQLPPVPPILQDNPGYDIQYVGKMALALKSLDVQALIEVMGIIEPFVQFDPGILKNINFQRTMRGVAIRKGLPGDFLNSEKEMEDMAKAEAEQAEKQQMMQALPTIADSVSKLQKPTAPGSPLEGMGDAMGALGGMMPQG